MNDDALFLVVFFCTAALSGLAASVDKHPLPQAGAVRVSQWGARPAAPIRTELCAVVDRGPEQIEPSVAIRATAPTEALLPASTPR